MSGSKIKTPCRGRRRKTCNRAPKSCLYASGTKRRYCRKRGVTRKSR